MSKYLIHERVCIGRLSKLSCDQRIVPQCCDGDEDDDGGECWLHVWLCMLVCSVSASHDDCQCDTDRLRVYTTTTTSGVPCCTHQPSTSSHSPVVTTTVNTSTNPLLSPVSRTNHEESLNIYGSCSLVLVLEC